MRLTALVIRQQLERFMIKKSRYRITCASYNSLEVYDVLIKVNKDTPVCFLLIVRSVQIRRGYKG